MDLGMFPFLGEQQNPQVELNWRRETRRREEGLIIVVIKIDVDL
jgi:hypothetical protein